MTREEYGKGGYSYQKGTNEPYKQEFDIIDFTENIFVLVCWVIYVAQKDATHERLNDVKALQG